ncbi:unnamed protein product [Camellia sinensis]
MDTFMRRAWLQDMKQGDDKKSVLAVQSLRNTLMTTILTASIAITINLSLAVLANNTYKAGHLFTNRLFDSQAGAILVLKYGAASLFLLVSFLCSSISIGCLTDAIFLINASADHEFSSPGYTQTILERGFLLAVVGSRVLCITFTLLLWMFGPVPVALSSVVLIWGLYELDFSGEFAKNSKKGLS